MKSRASEQARRRAERAHKLAREAFAASPGPLPMPYRRSKDGKLRKPSEAEAALYTLRRDFSRQHDPGYGRERPNDATAREVYEGLKDSLPPLSEIHADEETARQLILVTLDVAVVAGRYAPRPRQGQEPVAQRVTHGKLFDAISRRWSAHARQARDEDRAYALSQMKKTTAEAAWRDLHYEGVSLPVLWRLLRTGPLFTVKRGHVTLIEGEALRRFEGLVKRDESYGPSRAEHVWRVWVEGEDTQFHVHPEIVAERRYNVVPQQGRGRSG